MSISLAVPTSIAIPFQEFALHSGQNVELLMLAVLKTHFPELPSGLKAEFDALNQASDQDMAKVDRLLLEMSDEAR